MVIALAGRRIDAEGASPPRFPLANRQRVGDRLEELFRQSRARWLVCSGACGADLLALEVAGRLGLRRRVVLPFDAARFRRTSVVDRPGDWGPLFDRVCEEVKKDGNLVTLSPSDQGDGAYAEATRKILEEAESLARPGAPLAVAVWDGLPRDGGDHTLDFGQAAQDRGWPVAEVFTDDWQKQQAGVKAKLAKGGPRKLLALDGGGIRGLISIEILAAIEALLRQRAGDDGLVLADYFDYVAGTSTGAILAAGVALGWPVEKLRHLYLKTGPEMFHPARLLERIKSKFNDDNLSRMLRQEIGKKTTLGDDSLRTLLMIVLRNATTDSPWPVSNNPLAKYNQPDLRNDACNLKLPLWQLVRASTAAPTYFPPEVIEVGEKTFVFVDGGVTTYNCPAFQLFLMATVEPYNLGWRAAHDRMLLVSVGTGTAAGADASLRPSQMHLLYNASTVPAALMNSALFEQDFLCRVFGRCLVGEEIDSEVGDMIGKKGPVMPKLFTYLRYDCDLSREGLTRLGIDPRVKAEGVQKLDATEHLSELQAIGKAVGGRSVREGQFFGFGR